MSFKNIKDFYWDYDQDILNNFCNVEIFGLEDFVFLDNYLEEEELDEIFRVKRIKLETFKKIVEVAAKDLNERDFSIFVYCFILNFTQEEIAERLNITQPYVSFLLKKIVNRLKGIIDFDLKI